MLMSVLISPELKSDTDVRHFNNVLSDLLMMEMADVFQTHDDSSDVV